MSMHPTRNLFKEFKTGRIFVETGSYRGDAIQLAIDAGFEEIVSMDIDPANVEFCKSRFDLREPQPGTTSGRVSLVQGAVGQSRITVLRGDSAHDLWNVLDWFSEPLMFWLDAHWQMFENTDPGELPFPLLHELAQIGRHAIRTHTILIDDMLIMQPAIVGYGNHDVCNALLAINPHYQLEYFANPIINNILVAHV